MILTTINQPKTDGKQRVHFYKIAIAFGMTKEQANYYADAGVNQQTIKVINSLTK